MLMMTPPTADEGDEEDGLIGRVSVKVTTVMIVVILGPAPAPVAGVEVAAGIEVTGAPREEKEEEETYPVGEAALVYAGVPVLAIAAESLQEFLTGTAMPAALKATRYALSAPLV